LLRRYLLTSADINSAARSKENSSSESGSLLGPDSIVALGDEMAVLLN
jgi:hypothetical protein